MFWRLLLVELSSRRSYAVVIIDRLSMTGVRPIEKKQEGNQKQEGKMRDDNEILLLFSYRTWSVAIAFSSL